MTSSHAHRLGTCAAPAPTKADSGHLTSKATNQRHPAASANGHASGDTAAAREEAAAARREKDAAMSELALTRRQLASAQAAAAEAEAALSDAKQVGSGSGLCSALFKTEHLLHLGRFAMPLLIWS